MTFKKLTRGVALASMAMTGCGDTRAPREGDGGRDSAVRAGSQEEYVATLKGFCRELDTEDRCDFDIYDTYGCVWRHGGYLDELSDDCLQRYVNLFDCYLDALGPGCPDDVNTNAFCTAELEALEDPRADCPMPIE
ncbi:MAG: hypothetical protein CMN30_22035 [Sandaracinus sp.]|nr:hypothetical protein [Sandaracinus sp.]MAR56497.1 hypothetical protein [Rickettsiales bacterium]|tara:strand:+ start:3871 stop:4278 length:408 start_codon:yes stop_codon:yes gene_type:complete